MWVERTWKPWILKVVFFTLFTMVKSVDKSKFKTCAQSSFCIDHRSATAEPEVRLKEESLSFDGSKLSAELSIENDALDFSLYITKSGAIRVQIDEKTPRWKPPYVLVEEGLTAVNLKESHRDSNSMKFQFGESQEILIDFKPLKISLIQNGLTSLILNHFGQLYYETDTRDCKKQPGSNSNSEATNEKSENAASNDKKSKEYEPEVIDWGEDGNPIYAEAETTEPANPDADNAEEDEEKGVSDDVVQGEKSKAVGVDIVLVGSSALFGLPEHTTSFALPNTIGNNAKHQEPFRLYTLDVFEYELDNTMALYGAIPIIYSHSILERGISSLGIFWNNPTDTFVDVSEVDINVHSRTLQGRKVKWMSESGNFDLFIFPGKSPQSIMKQIKDTTGPTTLPPLFSLGYHQCRWNYNDEADLLNVNRGFEQHDIPVDVLWLDIEHTNGRRYFTFNSKKFPTPEKMFNEIDYYSRKVVLIVDPHIKRDSSYYVHKEAESLGLYIKDSSREKDFDGWCWPGSSSYIDFTAETARQFWAGLFSVEKFKGTVNGVVHIWNDMNEPSVFNHPEVTIPKDTKNLEGIEFREFHNLYGFYFQASTQAGLLLRDLLARHNYDASKGHDLEWRALKFRSNNSNQEKLQLQRGFVLTRAFYAGSQRFGAVWTGDNAAEWSHLRASVPMLLSASMVGFPFIGADVGGFFGNPSTDLLVRWYQAAAFQPFFRAHAHLESKRREPWLFGEEITQLIRSAISRRYRYLPYIYTLFRIAETTGIPVMRPLFFEFPAEKEVLDCEDQWLLGNAILVAPVLEENADTRVVRFPRGKWYDVETHEHFIGSQESQKQFKVTMASVPVFQQGGTIVAQKMRLRRSSSLMYIDPYTLQIALDEQGRAIGELYMDDESTFDYADKASYCHVNFEFVDETLKSRVNCPNMEDFKPDNIIERIVILGASPELVTFKSAIVIQGSIKRKVELVSTAHGRSVTIRNPQVKVAEVFEIKLSGSLDSSSL